MWQRSVLLAIAVGGGSLACTHVHHHHPAPPPPAYPAEAHPGPPPHAPAHGYRHKHPSPAGSVDLVFDSGLGVYVVVGWPGYYWHRDRYYRWADEGWMISARLDGGWAPCEHKGIPPGLRKKHGHAHKGHGKGKWKYPAKHDY